MCACVCVCVCMCLCMRLCTCVYVCMCDCVYVCVWVFVYVIVCHEYGEGYEIICLVGVGEVAVIDICLKVLRKVACCGFGKGDLLPTIARQICAHINTYIDTCTNTYMQAGIHTRIHT